MYTIFLINMPFAALHIPSLALTQLQTVVENRFQNQVCVKVFYLNHDFVYYMGGIESYKLTHSLEGLNSGIGEWFFRQAAFPELPDNTEEYFQRYYLGGSEHVQSIRRTIQEKRKGIEACLDDLIERYHLDQAELVGFTSIFAQNMSSFAMARKLKERNPDILTVIGGPGCEMAMGREIATHVEQLDFVFSGPAVNTFPRFIDSCLEGNVDHGHRIYGVHSRITCLQESSWIQPNNSEDGTSSGTFCPIGEELDINTRIELHYDAFLDSLEKNFPDKRVSPTLLFETSRGCWWGERSHCTFCGLNKWAFQYKAMSPEHALEQFESLFKFSSRCTSFRSVDNIMPQDYPTTVFPFLESPPQVTIFYEVRVNMNEEHIKALAQAGVKTVQPGIEAFATSTLQLVKKGTTAFHNIRYLKYCRMYDVHPVWNLLVGFPGEDEGVYRKYLHDLPLLMHLAPPYGLSSVRFDRYSHYFDHPEEYGLDLHPYDFYRLTYPFDEETLNKIAYYFLDHNGGADYVVTLNTWFGRMQKIVEQWRTTWFERSKAAPLSLFFKKNGDADIIHDSRSGRCHEYQISEITKTVLEYLENPRTVPELVQELSHIPDCDPEKEIDFVRERGLVFQEDGRLMNLVLAESPPGRENGLPQAPSVEACETNMTRNPEAEKPLLVKRSRQAHRVKVRDLKERSR